LRIRWIVLALAVFGAGVYVANASWLWGPKGRPTLLAHRGLAQEFSRVGLERDTCTATRIFPPAHSYLENTLPSIGRAFADGADIVEIDVHPTTDGEFAVFHDWTIDCRTNGHGVTRDQSMAYLKTLDIGYGYTADGGRTFPFRGRFVGAMPTLAEVAQAFPRGRFLLNIKSNDPREGDRLADYLAARGIRPDRLLFYGGDRPVARLAGRLPTARTLSRGSLEACATGYLLTGWFGRVPDACRNQVVFVPVNLRGLAWGWPNLFVARMARANSEVFVVGPYKRGAAAGTYIDRPEQVCGFIDGYAGGIMTDEIWVMGPALRRGGRPKGC
jgi:glycerophosphoryl diester phosphodiesterase